MNVFKRMYTKECIAIIKVFDKVWHDDIILKLKQNYISDNILNLFNFLRNRKERLVLNGQVPSLADVNVRVTQVFTISLLLSLIYVNDLADDLSNAKPFPDETSLFYVVHNVNTSADDVSNDLVKINK